VIATIETAEREIKTVHNPIRTIKRKDEKKWLAHYKMLKGNDKKKWKSQSELLKKKGKKKW
jgi:hypothetical protein